MSSVKFPSWCTPAFALLVTAGLYFLAKDSPLSAQMRSELASGFQFKQFPVGPPGDFSQKVRAVNGSLETVNAWVSSIGSSVAVGDLDGDGLSNDVCLVDPRTDLVHLFPVPGHPSPWQSLNIGSVSEQTRAIVATFGCRMADLNEDGRTDLLIYFGGRPPVVYLQHSPLEFVRREILQYDGWNSWVTTNAVLADLDGDSHLDIVLGCYFQDDPSILDREDQQSITAMPESMSRAFNGGKTRILRWIEADKDSPSVRYEEVDLKLSDEVSQGWTLGLAAADLNGDLLPEIYLANDFGPDRLLVNESSPGSIKFRLAKAHRSPATPPSYSLGWDSFKGMGAEFGDVNQDGMLDIYVSNVGEYEFMEGHFLYLSNGDSSLLNKGIAPYDNVGMKVNLHKSGWGWGVRLADFNNDGELEALQGTGFFQGEIDQWPEFQELAFCSDSLMHMVSMWPRFGLGDDVAGRQSNPFHVLYQGVYYDLSKELNMDSPTLGRGIATSDVDGDGDLDYVLSNQWSSSMFYRNDCPDCGDFLSLNLRLPLEGVGFETRKLEGFPTGLIPSRTAFGAVAILDRGNGNKSIAYVDGGSGHSGQKSPQVHFGLGKSSHGKDLKVQLNWRDTKGKVHQKDMLFRPGAHTVYLGDLKESS